MGFCPASSKMPPLVLILISPKCKLKDDFLHNNNPIFCKIKDKNHGKLNLCTTVKNCIMLIHVYIYIYRLFLLVNMFVLKFVSFTFPSIHSSYKMNEVCSIVQNIIIKTNIEGGILFFSLSIYKNLGFFIPKKVDVGSFNE